MVIDISFRQKGYNDGDAICEWIEKDEKKSNVFFIDLLEKVKQT